MSATTSFTLARVAITLLALAPAGRAAAGVFDVLEPDTAYTLFHPTPRGELKPIIDPRGPRTVDAGHVQVGVDVIEGAWTQPASSTAPTLQLFAIDARLGLTRRTDVQVAFAPYREAEVLQYGGVMTPGRGIGDVTVRLGLNLWGNDGGLTAAGLVPYVRVPTATGGVGSGAFEGGVILPLTVALPAELTGLARAQLEFADDAMGRRGVHPRAEVGGGLARTVLGPVGAQVVWTTTADAERAPFTYRHAVDAAGRVVIGRDLEVRAGASVGMLASEADIHPYLRVSYRR